MTEDWRISQLHQKEQYWHYWQEAPPILEGCCCPEVHKPVWCLHRRLRYLCLELQEEILWCPKQLKHSPSLHTMSEHCFGSLTSQRRRECESLQNGHCDLPLASVVGFSAPMWNATVGRGGLTWGFACDPIFSTYSWLRTAACNSVMVHSPLPCVLFQFCLVLGGSFSRSIGTSKLSCESFGFLRIVGLQMCPTVVS